MVEATLKQIAIAQSKPSDRSQVMSRTYSFTSVEIGAIAVLSNG